MKPTHLIRVAMHALLVLASASAQADLVSPSTELDGAVAASPDSSLSLSASAWDPRGAVRPGTAFALAVALPGGGALADGSLRATANAVGSLTLPNSSTASLWTFITSVRAQQRGDTFSVLETNLTLVLMAESLPPSQVPLPAAAWFLVMGLLGMAGVKLTGPRTRRNDLPTGAEPALA